MELREFVTQTLVQIQQGVQDAIAESSKLQLNGAVNPIWGVAARYDSSYVRDVTFDVAVIASDRTTESVGGGINVWSLKAGADMSRGAENGHVSRIQFSIPLIPPATSIGRTEP